MKKVNLKINKWDKVEIVWLDAYTSNEQGWRYEDNVQEKLIGMTVYSVGYVLTITDDYVTIVSCMSFDDPPIMNREISIPVGCIITISKLKEVKNGRTRGKKA